MDFIVKLLFLSGKYISQVAGRTILEIIHRSKELHKHISVKYEKASEIVKPYNSMLDLLNERVKEASENDVHFACINEEFKKQLGEHISQLPARKSLEDNIVSTEPIRQQRGDQQTLLENENKDRCVTTERNFDDFEYDKIYADLCRDLLKQSSAILNAPSVKKLNSDSTDQIIASTTIQDNSLKITEINDDKTLCQTNDANAEFTNSDLEFGLVSDALDDFGKEISSSKVESFDFDSSLINEKEEDYLDLKDIKKYQVSNITLNPFSNLYFGDAYNMIHRTEQLRTNSHKMNTTGEKRPKELRRSTAGSKEQNRLSNTAISRKVFKLSFNELLNIEDVIQVNNKQTIRGLRQEIENRMTLQNKNREHFRLFERKLYEKVMKNKTKQIAKDRESRSLILAHNTSHYNKFESKLGQRLKKEGISKIGSRRRLCSRSGVESNYGHSFTRDVNEFVKLLEVNERAFRKLERKVTQMLLQRGLGNINFIKINYKEINKPICKYCLSHKDQGEMKEREKILDVNRKAFEEFERDIERIVILDKNKPIEKEDELINKEPSTYDNRVKIPSQSTLKLKPYKTAVKKKKSLVSIRKQNIKPNFTFDKSVKINIKGLQKLQKLSVKEPFSLKTKLSNNDREDMRERASIIEVNAKAFEIFEDSVSCLIPIKNNCNLTISRTMTSQSKDNFHGKPTTSSSQNRFDSITSNINTTPTVSETLKELLDKPMASNSNKSNVQINKNSIILDKTTASRNDFDRIIKTLKKEYLKNQAKLSVNPSATNYSPVKNKNSECEKRNNTLKYFNDKSRTSNSQHETIKEGYSIVGKDETLKEPLNSKDQFVDNLRVGDKGKTPKSSNITFPSANAVTEYKEKPIKTSVMSTENQFDHSKRRNAIIKAEMKSENALVEKPTDKKDIYIMKDVYSSKAIMNQSTHNFQNQKKSIIKLNNIGGGSTFRIGDFVSRKCFEKSENVQHQTNLMGKKETEEKLNVKQSLLPLKSSNGSNTARYNMNKDKSLNYLKINNKMPENANRASNKEQIDELVTKPNFQEEMAGDKFFQNLQTNTHVMCKNIKKEYRSDTNELQDSLKNEKVSLSNRSNEQYRVPAKYQVNTSDLKNDSNSENINKITSELNLKENSSTKSDNNCVGITQSRTDTYLTLLNNSKNKYKGLPNDLEGEFHLHKTKFFKNAENLTKEPNEGERLNGINQKSVKPSRIPNIIVKNVQKLKDNDISNVDKSGKTAGSTSEKNVFGKKLFQGMYVKNLSSDSNSKDETTSIAYHDEKREHNYENNKETNPNMSSNIKLNDQPSVANTLDTNEWDSSTSDPDCSHHGFLINSAEQNEWKNSKNQNTCDVTDSKEYIEMLNEINKLVARNEKKKSLLQLLTNTAGSHDNEPGSSSIKAKSIHRNYGFSSFNNNEIINNNRDGSTSEIDTSKLSQVKEGIGTKSHLKQAESSNEFLKVKNDDQMTRNEQKCSPTNPPVMPKSSHVLKKHNNNDSEADVMPYMQLKTIQIPKNRDQITQNQKKGGPVSETIIPTPQFHEKNNKNLNMSTTALQPKEDNEVPRDEKKKGSLSKTVTLKSDHLNDKLCDCGIKTVQKYTEIDEKNRPNKLERAREDKSIIENEKMKIIDNKFRNTTDQYIKNSNPFEKPQFSWQYKEIKNRSNIPCAKNITKINDNLSDKIVNNSSSSSRIFCKVGSKSDKGNISNSKLAGNANFDDLKGVLNPVANTSKYSEKNNEYLLEKSYNTSAKDIPTKNKESDKNVNFLKINGMKFNAQDIITYKDEYCLKKVVAPIPIDSKEPEKLCRDSEHAGPLKQDLKTIEVNNQLKSEDVNDKKNTNVESVIPNKEQSKKILRYQFNNSNNTYKNDFCSTNRKQNPFRRSHADEVEEYRNLLSREFINNMEREDDANKELKNIEKNRLTSNLKDSKQNHLNFERNARIYAKPFELSRTNVSDKHRLQTMNFKIPQKTKEVIVSNNFSDTKLQERSQELIDHKKSINEIEKYNVDVKKEANINSTNEFPKVPETKTTVVPKYIERSQTDSGKSIRKFAFVPPKVDVSYKDEKLYSHQYNQSYKQKLQNTDLNTAQKYSGASVQSTFSDTKSQKQSSNLNDENRNEKTEDHKSFDMKIEAKTNEQSQASSKQNIRKSSLIPSRVETPQKQEMFHKYLNTLQKTHEQRLQIMDLNSSQKNTETIVQNNFSNMKLQDQSKKLNDENKIKPEAHINSNNELLRNQERVTAIPKYTERTQASAKQNVENLTFISSKMHDASYEQEMSNTHLSALQKSIATNDEQTLNLLKPINQEPIRIKKNIDKTEKYRTLTCRKYVNNFYANSDKSTNVAEKEGNFRDIDQNQNKFENNSRETEYYNMCVPTRMLKQEMQSTSVNPLQKSSSINSDQENNSSITNVRKINQKSIYLNNNVHQIDDGVWRHVHSNKEHFNVAKKPLISNSKEFEQLQINSERNTENPRYMKSLLPARMNASHRQDIQKANSNVQELDQRPMWQNKKMNEAEARHLIFQECINMKKEPNINFNNESVNIEKSDTESSEYMKSFIPLRMNLSHKQEIHVRDQNKIQKSSLFNNDQIDFSGTKLKKVDENPILKSEMVDQKKLVDNNRIGETNSDQCIDASVLSSQEQQSNTKLNESAQDKGTECISSLSNAISFRKAKFSFLPLETSIYTENDEEVNKLKKNSNSAEEEKEIDFKNLDTIDKQSIRFPKHISPLLCYFLSKKTTKLNDREEIVDFEDLDKSLEQRPASATQKLFGKKVKILPDTPKKEETSNIYTRFPFLLKYKKNKNAPYEPDMKQKTSNAFEWKMKFLSHIKAKEGLVINEDLHDRFPFLRNISKQRVEESKKKETSDKIKQSDKELPVYGSFDLSNKTKL